MIGLDTNVLLRLLTRDDPTQFAAATRFVDAAIRKGTALFVNRIVLAELAWVLSRQYRRPRAEIADTLEQLLQTAEFEVEDGAQAWEALREYRRTTADFADCLIGAANKAAGCTTTATFDRGTRLLPTFSVLS